MPAPLLKKELEHLYLTLRSADLTTVAGSAGSEALNRLQSRINGRKYSRWAVMQIVFEIVL